MVQPRGRVWVTLWLVFVLAILAWVVARQTSAVVSSGELDALRNQRSLLEARRAELLRRIREAESRAVLVPRAEALGLRLPADSEIVILPAPTPGER
jgi:hypothetical protein